MFHFPPQREESTPSGSLEEADRKREGGQAIEYSTRTAYVRAEKNASTLGCKNTRGPAAQQASGSRQQGTHKSSNRQEAGLARSTCPLSVHYLPGSLACTAGCFIFTPLIKRGSYCNWGTPWVEVSDNPTQKSSEWSSVIGIHPCGCGPFHRQEKYMS